MHTPFTDRHPPVIFKPLANVLVAVVDATFKVETERPPRKVDVAEVFVALKRGAVTVPVNVPAPFIESLVPGVVVPTPKLVPSNTNSVPEVIFEPSK